MVCEAALRTHFRCSTGLSSPGPQIFPIMDWLWRLWIVLECKKYSCKYSGLNAVTTMGRPGVDTHATSSDIMQLCHLVLPRLHQLGPLNNHELLIAV